MSFSNLVSANQNCSRCSSKHALTKCIKGALCHDCGSQCHAKFQHPVEFILHSLSQGRLQKTKTVKSMVALSKANIKDTPLRITKVSSKTKKSKINLVEPKDFQGSFTKAPKEPKKKLSLNRSKAVELMK